jgi:hypothetical protein
MHYQSDAFAKSGRFTLLSRIAPSVIPRNMLITDTDAKELQLLYKCTTGQTAIQWNEEPGNSWANSCDFVNSDMSKVTTKSEWCSFHCRVNLGCTHYTWSNGVCYLKKNTAVTKANAFGNNNNLVVCGILKAGNFNLRFCYIYRTKALVRYFLIFLNRNYDLPYCLILRSQF